MVETLDTLDSFEGYVERTRERLNKAREAALAARKEADDKLSVITLNLEALASYEAAMKGRKPTPARAGNGQSKRKPRETGKRVELLNIIKTEYPDGVTRSGLLAKFGVKGDKQGEQSLSNTLSALKRTGQITLKNGTYRAT